ncbi:uncharacterized protein LOC108732803 isoform X2 [Agrilus planipennis]|nr:uncharacterized protein LOC108732803 isoform X2 [Agrilus planipennis]
MDTRPSGSHSRKIWVIQKTDAIIEKELQLKFLKESFPGVNPMALHDALCEVNFNADKAAQLLMGISKKVSEILPFTQWKNELTSIISSGNKCVETPLPGVINKRSSNSNTTNDTKRAKLETLFTEKKSTRLTPGEVKKPLVSQKRVTAHMTLNFIPKHENRDSLNPRIDYVDESSSSETKLSRNEPLVKPEENFKQLRSGRPIESNIMDFIIKKRSKKLSEKKGKSIPSTDMTSSDSTSPFSIVNSPMCYLQEQTVSSSDFNPYDGSDLENDRNILLNIFQTAGFNDLNFITSFSKRAVDAIIECRPYKSWMDLIQKFENNKFLDIDVLNTTRQLLDIYRNLKNLILKLEEISKTIKNEIVLETIKHQPSLVSPFVRLMEHQMLGLNWLVSMKEQRINGILVDEDQFSTSVQVISFLAYLKEVKATKVGIPHLVVVPSWKQDDWRSDFRRISPELKVFFYHGSKEERRQYRNEWYKGELSKYDVILATQGTFISTPEEIKMFRIMQLHCVIFDDTPTLKDINNVFNEHVMKIKASQKLLLLSKPPQNNILEVLSLLKFVFPIDFDISLEDLATFINNKYIVQKSNLSSFHLEIIQHAAIVLKIVLFQRLKKDVQSSPIKNDMNKDHVLPTNINDQIESIIKEIQRLELPIKLAFNQLTTSPRVFVKKINLLDEMTRIKESGLRRDSRVAARGGGRGYRGRRGLGRWHRARGRSYAWRHDDTDSSSAEWSRRSSTESLITSTDFDNLTDEISNPHMGSTKGVRNVARRGRTWSCAVGTSDSPRQAPSLRNVARRGRKLGGKSQLFEIPVDGDENDKETSTARSPNGKRRGRGRSKLQGTDHTAFQTTSTATKKILEVNPRVIQTTRTENDVEESESDDTFTDSDFKESDLVTSTSTDTDDSWNQNRGRSRKKLRNSKRKKNNTRAIAERRLKSAGHDLENMLNDIWNKKNKSQDACEEDITEVSKCLVKIEFEDDGITIKEEPLEKEIKVEVGEDSNTKPFIKLSPSKQQTPPSPQEDPLFIEEEERDQITEGANIFSNDIILKANDIAKDNNQNTTAPCLVNKFTEQSKKELRKSSSCVNLTSDIIVVSDDSEVEEQLNKKISFNEVLAGIDEQGTNDNSKNIKEESNKVSASKGSVIIGYDKSDKRDDFTVDISSDTDSVDDSVKEINKPLKLDDIMMIILGNERPAPTNITHLINAQLNHIEIIQEKPPEKDVSGNPHSSEQESTKVSSFLNEPKSKSSSSTVNSDTANDNDLLKQLADVEENNIEIVSLPAERNLSSTNRETASSSNNIIAQSAKMLSLETPESTCLKTGSLPSGLDSRKEKHSSSPKNDSGPTKASLLGDQSPKISDNPILKHSDTNNAESSDKFQSSGTPETDKSTSANILYDMLAKKTLPKCFNKI